MARLETRLEHGACLQKPSCEQCIHSSARWPMPGGGHSAWVHVLESPEWRVLSRLRRQVTKGSEVWPVLVTAKPAGTTAGNQVPQLQQW